MSGVSGWELARERGERIAVLEREREQLVEEVRELRGALVEKPGQHLLNAARRLVAATDSAERNAALGDLVAALANGFAETNERSGAAELAEAEREVQELRAALVLLRAERDELAAEIAAALLSEVHP